MEKYERKISKTENNCILFLESIITPSLTRIESAACDGLITINEIRTGIKELAPNKSPGNDGLTKEFYQCFVNDIERDLLESFNHS